MKKLLISTMLLLGSSAVHAADVTHTSTIASITVSTFSNSFVVYTTNERDSAGECVTGNGVSVTRDTNAYRYEFSNGGDLAGQALYALLLTAKTSNNEVEIAFDDAAPCYGSTTNDSVITRANIR